MSDHRKVADARDLVIKASLTLAASEWSNGRETPGDSMDLDFAQDQLDDALKQYVRAANAASDLST